MASPCALCFDLSGPPAKLLTLTLSAINVLHCDYKNVALCYALCVQLWGDLVALMKDPNSCVNPDQKESVEMMAHMQAVLGPAPPAPEQPGTKTAGAVSGKGGA